MKFKHIQFAVVAISLTTLTACSSNAEKVKAEEVRLLNQQTLDTMAKDLECRKALFEREKQDRERQEYYDAIFAKLQPGY